MPLLQLFYISTLSGPLDPRATTDILMSSRRNNALAGITGILIQGGNRFLQLLEGDPARVEVLFTRIRADTRHRAIVMLGRDWTNDRSFPDWAMAYEDLDGVCEGRLVPVVEALIGRLRNPLLQAELRDFARLPNAA